ncbi:MAG: M16 family metallopeptidase, partial [Myxococcales bacterium]
MLLPLLAALVAASATPAPDPAKAFPFPVEVHTLPNGLRVAFIAYDSPGLVAYYTLMRVGSRNEVEKGKSGFAHFFEHMMFRGTKNHSAEDYNQTVTRLGLNTNAFTSEDMTVYHLYGPARALPTIIEYEADRFQNLFYDEPAFRTEAGAILGEYVKSASNPEQKMFETMSETAFTRHTYAHTVIGYLKDIQDMPSGYQYSREFFRRYYTPDNATLFIAGDFDKAATLAQIEKAYGSWKGKLDAVRVPPEPR